MSEALVKPKDPVELLRAKYEKLQDKDIQIVRAMDRFAELPSFVEEVARKELTDLLANGTDAEIEAKYGFKSKRELRIALYGTLPNKEWPAAMRAAHERVMARERKAGVNKPRNTFNLNVINMPAPVPPRTDEKIIEVIVQETIK